MQLKEKTAVSGLLTARGATVALPPFRADEICHQTANAARRRARRWRVPGLHNATFHTASIAAMSMHAIALVSFPCIGYSMRSLMIKCAINQWGALPVKRTS